MKIVNLKQTCNACPSQWEGKLDDGRMIYIRYRWGNLTVTISNEETDDIDEAIRGDLIFEKVLDDEGWDGCLTTQEMLLETGYVIYV